MPFDLSKIKEILNGDFYSVPQLVDSSYFFRLQEKAANSTIPSVHLVNVPKESILIQMDKCPPLEILHEDYRKRCDFVMISREMVLFFELKSSDRSSSVKDMVDQFKGAEAVFEYIGAGVRLFAGRESWWQKNGYRIGYVAFIGSGRKYLTGMGRAKVVQKFVPIYTTGHSSFYKIYYRKILSQIPA